ncbi:TetR/AcrR family transcriptional regulator [Pseudonocardia acidicola]|uniref:TetR/AcrR family transcriptional regulator n=1 Tax=Pseudonocardia acidicola TaxID=2724939 RepID=A0ABX1S3U1_9PSEU|nr:TetR/AcrR family transcriptional regulator [Pseudonocardia acidicola]NMH96249.1 TetR/AcrR family transcriptional regulator [Pseudonocardia acidicola]
MDERRTDTRGQIREVALELFAEQGYEKTSLREIAERLGVTKAAVYYHYKTKEEIVGTLFDDLLAGIDEIVAWARERPRDVATRRELLRRYSALLAGRSTARMVRFLQESQTSFRELAAGAEMKKRLAELTGLLAEPGQSVAGQLRGRMSVIALHLGAFLDEGIEASEEERREAALEIALELAGD